MGRRGQREVETRIVDLDDQGLGVGRFESRLVRARNALPNETVTVRVLKRRGGVWWGEAATPETGAAERRPAPCPNYPRCGGCALQHLSDGAQLAHKHAVLERALAAQGVEPLRLRLPVSGPRLHYRYKARLGVRRVGDDVLAGFRESFGNRVVRMTDCKTLAMPFAAMLPALRETLASLSVSDRVPQVELAGGDSDFAVVIRHLSELDADDRQRLEAFERATAMRVFLQPGGYDTVAPLDPAGDAHLSYGNPDFGLCFRFRPTDFTQVNPFVNRLLVRDALLALAAPADAHVLDLFCGIGNFSLALARSGARVSGFESNDGAVARARWNAAVNGLSERAEFASADLYDAACPELPEADRLLLDPPRSGAGPNLEQWAGRARLERIAYVSCNPQTFAGDAARLAALGFDLQEAGVYDMFPHTSHVETLGLFVRRGSTG